MNSVVNKMDTQVSGLLQNTYVNWALRIILVLYAAFSHVPEGGMLQSLAENIVFRLAIAVLIVYLSFNDPTLAILLSICFVVTIQAVNKNKVNEITKMSENFFTGKKQPTCESLGEPGDNQCKSREDCEWVERGANGNDEEGHCKKKVTDTFIGNRGDEEEENLEKFYGEVNEEEEKNLENFYGEVNEEEEKNLENFYGEVNEEEEKLENFYGEVNEEEQEKKENFNGNEHEEEDKVKPSSIGSENFANFNLGNVLGNNAKSNFTSNQQFLDASNNSVPGADGALIKTFNNQMGVSSPEGYIGGEKANF